MNNSANRNPYAASLEAVREIFEGHLSGRPGGLLGVISSTPLGPDALKAVENSAPALGYGEGQCCYVRICSGEGNDASKLGANDLKMLVEGMDPLALVATDAQAASLLSYSYKCEVPTDATSRVLGRTCVAFRDFEKLMDSSANKQKAWALLKTLRQ